MQNNMAEVAMLLQTVRTLMFLGILAGSRQAAAGDQPTPQKKPEQWHALHLLVFKTDKDLEVLGSQIPKLAQMGVNVLILEIDYNFQFQSHPELRSDQNGITTAGARQL